jgi:ABC-type transporter Mla subunit MlaD
MLDATNRMVVALEAVAKTMGADIPNAASNAAYTTRGAADSMVHDWDRVHDAATGAAEGHSPSGIKQITVRTIEAQAAVELAANQMIAAFGQIDAVMDTFESVHQQIEDYRNVDTVIRSLTAAQKSFIEVALVSGVSIADIAALLGTSTIAIQSYVDANKKAAAAVTATAAATAQHAQVMADINKAIADHNSAAADMARLTAEQRTFIDSAVAAGVSVSTLAGALGTTVDAIQLYVDAQKAAADATTAAATAAAKHVQVIDDINKAIADHDGAAAALAQLTGDQQLFIGRALEAGVSVSALAEAFGTTVDAINLYVEAQKAAADASKATEKAATDAAAAAAKEAQKITDINTAISQHKGAADEAAKFTQDQRTFINDAIAAGVSVAALADVMDTTTYAIQYFVDAQKALTQGGAQTQTPPLTGSEAFEQWRQGYSQSVASPVEYYATGADVIPFPSRGTDTVPAMLTPGEGVLTVEQNKEYHQTVEGPSNQEVVDAVNGLRTDMTVKMPRALARALHTGLVGLRTAS